MPIKVETRGRPRKYTTEAQRKRAKQLWSQDNHKRNCTAFHIRFSNSSAGDVIAFLKSIPNKPDYLRKLIREDMRKNEK